MVAAHAAGVPAASVGRFGGETVKFGPHEAAMADLSTLYRTAFAAAIAP
jgi:phosphoribosylformylglycinamidine synthase